jgi:fructoselysine-6-P-deglycase FrlB-like protein
MLQVTQRAQSINRGVLKGLLYQEQCAYKKGLTYIAMTKGVTVEITANMDVTQSSYGAGSSRGALRANIKMQGKEIQLKARIIEKWHDSVSDIFYVLIKEE